MHSCPRPRAAATKHFAGRNSSLSYCRLARSRPAREHLRHRQLHPQPRLHSNACVRRVGGCQRSLVTLTFPMTGKPQKRKMFLLSARRLPLSTSTLRMVMLSTGFIGYGGGLNQWLNMASHSKVTNRASLPYGCMAPRMVGPI